MPFDASSFMQTQMDEPLETEFKLVPVGEYSMTIGDFDHSAFEEIKFTYKQGERKGEEGTMTKVTLPFIVQDDKVKAELNRDRVVIPKQLILDISDTGGLDTGTNKNIELGRIRAAAGQNEAGPWSISNLRGAGPFMGKVEHVEFERRDGTKGKRAEVVRVTRIV